MIVVLADDLTGAAELAGAAWKRGFTAEVQREFSPQSSAEVICVDTDTRSLSRDLAAAAVQRIASQVAQAKPRYLYKKCDSVLRGQVLAEMRAIMAATGKGRAILVSANPSRGRVIRGGEYFVQGKPVNETAFAHDPEYPRISAVVAELLGGDLTGISTPDAESPEDLIRHARKVQDGVLPAGGVEFFQALLESDWRGAVKPMRTVKSPASGGRTLFVCGSAAAWSSGRGAQGVERGVPIVSMPDVLLSGTRDESAMVEWAQRIEACFGKGSNVMAAIGQPVMQTSFPASLLAGRLADVAARVLRKGLPERVCAEGGATAAALAQAMGWGQFVVAGELAEGVVDLRPVDGLQVSLIIKVGSYDWPESVW
ncbi:MAG: hypothetical protein K0Q55_678 [Verrucomicrobia bacterium]|jgi:hypothetical protein|nr:hypothetical protein [Verrucomicrobiota bacterium]